MNILDLPKGAMFHVRHDKSEFYKELQKIFNLSAIPFNNPCCPDADLAALQTVGYDGASFKTFNPSTEVWDTVSLSSPITAATGFTNNLGITAFAGGGRASATQLGTQYFQIVSTVATDGDSVKLPLGVINMQIVVRNSGANSLDVFNHSSATAGFDGAAATVAVRISPNTAVLFECTNSTTSGWVTTSQKINPLSDGTAALPSYAFGSQKNMGLYKVSSTELGISVSGAKSVSVNATGLLTDSITEKTFGAGIILAKPIIRKAGTAKALNTTGAITAAELAGGLVTSTTAAGVTGTLPTATDLATQLGAVQGTVFDFIVDNSAGANTFTVQVNTGITVGTTSLTGGDSLTVSTAQVVGMFRLIFTSATAAILRRIF